jgi:hypothetical protein
VTDPFSAWIRAYEVAWRAAGTDALSELLTSCATYRPAPFDEPLVGLHVIARFWGDEREGPDEDFRMELAIVAAETSTAVARVEVVYGDPPARTYRDLWIITLADDGRCSAFEEWPVHPGQARTAL